MKAQVTEAEKKEVDRAREARRGKQPYTSEMDDREVEGAAKPRAREAAAAPERK